MEINAGSGGSPGTKLRSISTRANPTASMVNAANHAVVRHIHWKKEFERMEPRLGRSKAIIAIARKLLVAVWHVLGKQVADRFAEPRDVANSFFAHAYRIGVKNLPDGQSALAFTREQLDRLGIGKELQEIGWSMKPRKLPPSKMLLQKSERCPK